MNRIVVTSALLVATAAGTAQAQQKVSSMNMTVSGITWVHNTAKNDIVKTAEQVPQEVYGFKPTPEVRSFGAILGHVADSERMFCALAEGKPQPPENMGSEKLTDKAALISALNSAFAYCDGVMAKLTDADLMKPATFFGQRTNVAGIIAMNAAHTYEHYGNLVTYMRLNHIVPPTSQRAPASK